MADYEPRGENSWRLTISLGKGPNGKKIRKRKTVTVEDPAILKSKKKLDQYLNEEWLKFKIEVEAGAYIDASKMKFSDFVNEWREKYASNPKNLSPTTLEIYEVHIKSRIIPAFGHMRIDQINAMKIVTFLNNLEKPGSRLDGREDPLDASTIGYIYRVLKNIFARADEWNVIKENPMNGLSKPKEKDAKTKMLEQRKNPQFYDEKEAQLVVDALYKESRKWRLLILGSMIGGCRRGELIALEWQFVNFEDGYIEIDNNIPLTKDGKAVEKAPKSTASYRTIDMPDWYIDELKTYYREWLLEKKHLGTKWLGEDRQFVFHNGKGQPYYYKHPSRWWERFCKRHDIRYIKFHGLRHSMGTLLLEDEDESNFDSILIAIQRRIGHARLSTTSDIYVHVTKKVKQRTAGKFDKFSRKTESNLGSVGVPLGSNMRQ
ncbi:hypothetical protein PAEVO_03460 [Paenibacillus sp. GM2FR]|uniref:tyrosine-type recombinase/integrase n=1 Tax=Paenibacillus sp. GM2FR TaxID=2059268 RepID=UPI000C279040|nr:site-specific integrase [Paenibacillus sp. GM2FR]PJN53626.1 hypothetical protein PAEVO_03460 [Paenibacillus sp. GM2FR]